MKPILIPLLIFCCWIPAAGADGFEKTEFKTPSGRAIRYLKLDPAKMEPGKQYPLVLALHGAGGRGQRNWEKNCYANAVLAKPGMREKYPCFVVAPTVDRGQSWSGDRLRDVFELIGKLQQDLPVDPDRVYVTGQSMGGYGTFQALVERPKLFAAGAPVCGGNNPANAGKISAVPIWIFHGAKDTAVPVTRSREMVEALKKAGGEPKYTEFPKTGHGAWTPAYNSAALWAWMFSQRRAKS
ncbi:MAG: prolyl oligopeptidase family serine peptidase [Verrucomicrobiota bacterium]